ADLTEVRRLSIMDVRNDQPLAHRHALHAADLIFLANRGDVAGQLLGHRATARIGSVLQRFDIVRILAEPDLRDAAHEILELFVLRDEVGFGVDLDGDPAGALDRHADQPFGRSAARLLGCRGKALGAQRIDRRLEIAAGFVERLLAIHHPGAGALAEILHVGCCVSHCPVLMEIGPKRRTARWVRRFELQTLPADQACAATASWATAASAGGASIAPMSAPESTTPSLRPVLAAWATASQ